MWRVYVGSVDITIQGFALGNGNFHLHFVTNGCILQRTISSFGFRVVH